MARSRRTMDARGLRPERRLRGVTGEDAGAARGLSVSLLVRARPGLGRGATKGERSRVESPHRPTRRRFAPATVTRVVVCPSAGAPAAGRWSRRPLGLNLMPARTPPEPTAPPVSDEAIAEVILGLLRRTHLSAGPDLAEVVGDQAAGIGAQDVVLYVIDFERATLLPLPSRAAAATGAHPQSVSGTVAGRAFATTTILATSSENGDRRRVWVPLLDGTERLGVMEMSFDGAQLAPRTIEVCERYGHLVALLITTKGMYSDVFEITRRRSPASIAAELARTLAPPFVFATDDLTVAGLLEPCYDNGGD